MLCCFSSVKSLSRSSAKGWVVLCFGDAMVGVEMKEGWVGSKGIQNLEK